ERRDPAEGEHAEPERLRQPIPGEALIAALLFRTSTFGRAGAALQGRGSSAAPARQPRPACATARWTLDHRSFRKRGGGSRLLRARVFPLSGSPAEVGFI